MAVSFRQDAIKYKKYMDEIGKVSSEIVMSPPDTREEHSEVSEEEIPEILIVIDKLLTGFDAPKNTILYIDL